MNLLFVISSSNKGANGGHFRSCLTIAKAMKRAGAEIKILNIGVVPSPVFSQEFVDVEYINVNARNWPIRLLIIFKIILNADKATRVLAFDFFSFFFVRVACYISKNPFGYFRCGGPNLNYFPFSKWIFCFSKESYIYFHKKFINSNIYLFPNRIEKSDSFSNGELREIVQNDFPIVLRIGRLVSNYNAINFASLKLSRILNELKVRHNLIFIGYPDGFDSIDYIRFKEECVSMPNVWLLTDIRYTKEASRFLKEASLVVGTGRGAMESVVSERSVAVYSESHDVPVLVNSAEVFNQSLNMNFSLRNNLGFVDADTNLKNLIELLNNRSYQDQVLDFLKSRKDEFDIVFPTLSS